MPIALPENIADAMASAAMIAGAIAITIEVAFAFVETVEPVPLGTILSIVAAAHVIFYSTVVFAIEVATLSRLERFAILAFAAGAKLTFDVTARQMICIPLMAACVALAVRNVKDRIAAALSGAGDERAKAD